MATFKELLKVILSITGLWRTNKNAMFIAQATHTPTEVNAMTEPTTFRPA
jgi:hypothetical protein